MLTLHSIKIHLGALKGGQSISEGTSEAPAQIGVHMTPPRAADGPQRLPHFGFCSRRKRHVKRVNRVRLRVRSLPGLFLLLGTVLVLVGMATAVGSYWPQRAHRSALLGTGLGNPQAARWGPAARGVLSVSGLGHHDRMRLLGPVIMGVGLFILICANTVLYENRDRDTRLQFMSALAPPRVQPCPYHWLTKLSVTDMTVLRVGCLPDSRAVAGGPQEVQPSASRVSSSTERRAVLEADFHLEPQLSSDANVKLDASLETAADWGVATPPRRSYSLGCRTVSTACAAGWHQGALGLRTKGPQDDVDPQSSLSSSLRRETSSYVCVDMTELSSWTPGSAEEWRHSSWPRLDLDAAAMSWDSRRESMDKLLD
ncbi:hypothetical protein GN956_G16889 [Arapaima gigas]